MRSHLLLVASAICFALIGIFIKLLNPGAHFASVAFYRAFFGFIFAIIVLPFFDKNIFKVNKRDIMNYGIIGFILSIGLITFSYANLNVPIANAYLFDAVYVLIVPIFAWFLLKEKLTKKEAIVIFVGFLGLLTMNPFNGSFAFGNFIALFDGVIFAMLLTYMRFEEREHDFGFVLWVTGFASFFLLPFFFLYDGVSLVAQPIVIPLLGIIGTGLAYTLMAAGLKKTKSDIAILIIFITTPIVSILLSAVILGEIPSINIIIGGSILLLSGVLLKVL